MRDIHVLAFTHRQLEVSQVGKLHIDLNHQEQRLSLLKKELRIDEIMFLSTCNRVEFIFSFAEEVDETFIRRFFTVLYPDFDADLINLFSASYEYYQEINAVKHLLKVASSVDSMIVGEREIITQVRKSYNDCRKFNLTGDKIRLLIRFTIETAKRIYTETNIADRPVSVVSLAYHTMRKKDIPLSARIIVVGAGVTNTNMLRFLKKHGFRNFVIFNRSLDKAEKLANEVGGYAFPLEKLVEYRKGFDLIITCTASEDHIISTSIYEGLLNGEKDAKTVIDIAIPHDLDPEVVKQYSLDHISVDYLQEISRKNLKERTKEIIKVDQIIAESTFAFRAMTKEREVELAMREIPQKVKEIKNTALEHVFAKDLENLDPKAKEKLNEIIDYLEKKYISVPMIMAKKILLEK